MFCTTSLPSNRELIPLHFRQSVLGIKHFITSIINQNIFRHEMEHLIYPQHFTDDETEGEKLNDLPKVTEQANAGSKANLF